MRLRDATARTNHNHPGGLSIGTVLAISIGGLIVIVVGLLLLVSYPIAQRNTVELVQQNARLLMESLVARTRDHLDPAKQQIEYLADLVARGRLSVDDRESLAASLQTSLAAVPQVSAIGFVDTRLQVLRAFRNRPEVPIAVSDWSDDPETQAMMRDQAVAGAAAWGKLFLAETAGETFVNVRTPVRTDGELVGVLVAGVSLRALSAFLTEVGNDVTYSPFILHGEDHVLAHPLLATDITDYPQISDLNPLPDLLGFGDPILSEIWSENRDRAIEAQFGADPAVRAVRYLGRTYLFLFRDLLGYGEKPLVVGTYLHLEDADAQVRRLRIIPMVGLAVLLVGLLLAFGLGRALGRPVRRIAAAAAHIRQLDIAGTPRVKPGLFRELNEAGQAFNAMVQGLRSFEAYVPRTLVSRLLRQNVNGAVPSEVREVTVLFTDIMGFTAMAEQMPAKKLVTLLNDHFTIVGQAVEAAGGTVDKYIGDAVMAFWGAPEAQPDHAERACLAAIAISRALRADNIRRRQAGLPPIRIRMGVHSGKVMIGNIGAPNRINYTVIGDAVNAAERLEVLSHELVDPALEACTLISAQTAAQLDPAVTLEPLGSHTLRGRADPTEVYRLMDD